MPSPISPELARVIEERRPATNPPPPLAGDLDEVTLQVMAALADPSSNGANLPAEFFSQLARQNNAMLTAPRVEIRKALARQSAMLEMAAAHYMRRSAAAPRSDHAEALMKISLGCSRALINVLGALNQLETVENEHALTV